MDYYLDVQCHHNHECMIYALNVRMCDAVVMSMKARNTAVMDC